MNKLKQNLQQNLLTVGSWVTLGHQSIIEIMATAGFDWLTIDLEHSVITIKEAQNLIALIQANNMQALVRVSKNEEVIIKRVLDAGADGIIVPMIKNADEARMAVDFAKYPPEGKRGVGLARAQKYGIGFDEYKNKLNNDLVIIAQIEHIEAVDNLEEILSVPGIDGIIIGPYDLSGSMNKPGQFDDPDVKEAIQRVEKVCKKMNKPLGFHVIQPDAVELKQRIDLGYTFLAFSLDFLFLGEKAREEMKKIK